MRRSICAIYVLIDLGYLCGWLSLTNTPVLAAVYLAQIRRLRDEERVLSGDPGYPALLASIEYRLIPLIYQATDSRR